MEVAVTRNYYLLHPAQYDQHLKVFQSVLHIDVFVGIEQYQRTINRRAAIDLKLFWVLAWEGARKIANSISKSFGHT